MSLSFLGGVLDSPSETPSVQNWVTQNEKAITFLSDCTWVQFACTQASVLKVCLTTLYSSLQSPLPGSLMCAKIMAQRSQVQAQRACVLVSSDFSMLWLFQQNSLTIPCHFLCELENVRNHTTKKNFALTGPTVKPTKRWFISSTRACSTTHRILERMSRRYDVFGSFFSHVVTCQVEVSCMCRRT